MTFCAIFYLITHQDCKRNMQLFLLRCIHAKLLVKMLWLCLRVETEEHYQFAKTNEYYDCFNQDYRCQNLSNYQSLINRDWSVQKRLVKHLCLILLTVLIEAIAIGLLFYYTTHTRINLFEPLYPLQPISICATRILSLIKH